MSAVFGTRRVRFGQCFSVMAAVALRLALALLVCAALCSAQNYTDPLDMLCTFVYF